MVDWVQLLVAPAQPCAALMHNCLLAAHEDCHQLRHDVSQSVACNFCGSQIMTGVKQALLVFTRAGLQNMLVHPLDQVVDLVLPVAGLAALHVVHTLLVHAAHCSQEE